MTQLFRFLVFVFCLLTVSAHAADDSPLFEAVKKGNKTEVEALLAKGADVNARAKDGETPLHFAAFGRNKDVAELLLAKGADVNAKDWNGKTPLHFAAFGRNKDVAELLLAKGADVNAKAENGETPLHNAASHGNKDIAELLLAKGADVNAKATGGDTPLHRASKLRDKDIAELLDEHTLKQARRDPRAALVQLTAQLRYNPDDSLARRLILKLASELKPAPAIPDEAVRYTGRAMFVFKTAKGEADYLDAAREYENAVRVAPWVANYYAELCTIYEKAGKYAKAKRACDFALVGTTDSSQAVDLKQRIAGLEIGIERNSAEAQAKAEIASRQATASAQQAAAESQARRFEGNWYRIVMGGSGDRPIRQSFTIDRDPNGNWRMSGTMVRRYHDMRLEGSEFKFKDQASSPDMGPVEYAGSLSADGRRLKFTFRDLPYTPAQYQARLEFAGGGPLRPPNDRFGHEEWLKE